MASIFTKDDNFVDKPNRNSFDMSYQNNLSLKFGKLVPCFCQEVIPGDSFRIKPTFGLRFLPQVFPVQTRMRAHMHFFYVRNRTIWKDWMDFIGKTKTGLTIPYLQSNVDDKNMDADPSYHESSIYDYMGLPVTVDCDTNPTGFHLYSHRGNQKNIQFTADGKELRTDTGNSFINISSEDVASGHGFYRKSITGYYHAIYREFEKPVVVSTDGKYYLNKTFKLQYQNPYPTDYAVYLRCICLERDSGNDVECYIRVNAGSTNISTVYTIDVPARQIVYKPLNQSEVSIKKIIGWFYLNASSNSYITELDCRLSVEVLPSVNRGYPFSSLNKECLPYGNGDVQYRINALPFRAYEAVYNSFYRNAENNPFKIDGVNEYNRYVKSLEGGAQYTTDFTLFNRNWEDDAFTTAVPTPQQGDAPRVGLTGSPNEQVTLHYMEENSDDVGQIVLRVDSQTGNIKMMGMDAPGIQPPNLVNALNDAINFGITINDLRNVNALQLWLEKNVRKGYKYRDQLLSHYGVSVSYNDLMMPEFIGGVSRDVTVNQVTQTVETDTGNLGDMAGQAYVVGDGQSITKYCDEHGYIIGILSVVPVPNYSQLIPKHFFKHDTFDYFFPEFGKIGMQPILNKEIAATASWLNLNGDDTFGYQRAWYDYLARVDEVHGKFNSQFYNFLIQRKFGKVPELGKEFTTVINEDLNNVFYSDDNEDKILGQIYFDVKAIRPIPLFGIPSLE